MNLQQGSVLTKRDFEAELSQILVEGVVEKNGGPDGSQIRKASEQTRSILALLDRYLMSNGVRTV